LAPEFPCAEQQQPPFAGVAELIGLACRQHDNVELLHRVLFMRRAYESFAFQHHEDVIVDFLIMHVILDFGVGVDNPKGCKFSLP
jgi:hypothetical protein